MFGFIFRICLLSLFLITALKFGDWKNWRKYYPTVLFVIAINLAVGFLTYHHALWKYKPDFLVQTQTTVEMLNAFVALPAVAFTFLSQYPDKNVYYQFGYITTYVFIFGLLEFIAHFVVGTLCYENGWSWPASILFDFAIFIILRLHYVRPWWGWSATLLVGIIIFILFDFRSGEFK
jgi:hypothetical protein